VEVVPLGSHNLHLRETASDEAVTRSPGLGLGNARPRKIESGLESLCPKTSTSYRRRDRPGLSDPKVLAPHLPLGWATGLGWCSTRHRGRYGRKRGAVGYPYHGYPPGLARRQLSRFLP
jgi:hypothetical protein